MLTPPMTCAVMLAGRKTADPHNAQMPLLRGHGPKAGCRGLRGDRDAVAGFGK